MSSDGADVTSGGRLFQTWGPAIGKALSPTVDRLDCGWMRRLVLAEQRARRLGKSVTWTNGPRYDGAQLWRTLYVSTATLNWIKENDMIFGSSSHYAYYHHFCSMACIAGVASDSRSQQSSEWSVLIIVDIVTEITSVLMPVVDVVASR